MTAEFRRRKIELITAGRNTGEISKESKEAEEGFRQVNEHGVRSKEDLPNFQG